MNRLTKREDGHVIRVCQYTENQYGDVSCYGCVSRTKCNRDLFERLAMYEDMIESGELVRKDGVDLRK